ncbi:chemotaxis protein CheW [Rhodoferax sp.]|uniref:chemotaxis protein CheW n=1 Tax=Rhodoferax sp. TaxID=50421 RepID=UPI00276E8578|nr:chemotaxis protein CheW [Rhodoferax sp.]
MNEQLIVFSLGEQRYALRLAAVDGVMRAVAINPLPQAPGIVLGIVNVQGRIIPIINVRRRFGLPQREIALTDQIVIAHTARRTVGLVVDSVADVIAYPAQAMTEAQSILSSMAYVEGVVKLPDGLVLIHDLDRFLSLEEETSLEQALETT